MRVLVLHAHPDKSSYGGALHRETIAGLEMAGHTVDNCSLYAEGFDPVMSYQDRIAYYQIPDNRRSVENHVRRLEQVDAMVIVSPVWTLEFPRSSKAILIVSGFLEWRSPWSMVGRGQNLPTLRSSRQ